MKKTHFSFFGLAATLSIVTLATLSKVTQAQTQVLNFIGGSVPSSGGNNTVGWEFSVSTTVTITDLGIWDEGNNGLVNSHKVGLWTNSGALLSSTTMVSGLSGTAVVSGGGAGSFRYNNISPVVLTPGNYVVGGEYILNDADVFRTGVNPILMASGFAFSSGRSAIGSGFAFPLNTVGGNVFFGPNLRFAGGATAAPEPGTFALLTLGMVGGIIARRKK